MIGVRKYAMHNHRLSPFVQLQGSVITLMRLLSARKVLQKPSNSAMVSSNMIGVTSVLSLTHEVYERSGLFLLTFIHTRLFCTSWTSKHQYTNFPASVYQDATYTLYLCHSRLHLGCSPCGARRHLCSSLLPTTRRFGMKLCCAKPESDLLDTFIARYKLVDTYMYNSILLRDYVCR
jgi:hypothetical protein